MAYCVYLHTIPKKISGYDHDKYYVGITKNSPQERWRNNGFGYKRKSTNGYPVFWYAIVKYGWDNITHTILETGLTREEACAKEQYYIAKYHSNNIEYGYNRTNGGDGSCGQHEITERQRQTRSRNMKNIRNREDVKAKRKKAHEKMVQSEKFKAKSSETLKRMWKDPAYREKHSGKNCTFGQRKFVFSGKYSAVSKKVVCLNTGEIFDCITDAKKKYNANNISRCCNKMLFSSGNNNGEKLCWSFYEDFLQMSKEDVEKRINLAKTKGR